MFAVGIAVQNINGASRGSSFNAIGARIGLSATPGAAFGER
jgi:hypothetical protein